MPDKITVKVGRQNWRAWLYGVGPRWYSVRMELAEPDVRPFACGPNGKPTSKRIGRSRIIVRVSSWSRRVLRDDESRIFDKTQLRALDKLLAPLLRDL